MERARDGTSGEADGLLNGLPRASIPEVQPRPEQRPDAKTSRLPGTAAIFLVLGMMMLVSRQGARASTRLDTKGLLSQKASAKESLMRPLTAMLQQAFHPIASSERGSYSDMCQMSDTQCPVASMPKGRITAVSPGQETRCLLESSPPYIFQVIPADLDKLFIYFDMGGSCWDELTANLGTCLTGVAELSHEGIFDHQKATRPFGDHTLLVVGYCSGDAFVGRVDRPTWVIPGGGNVSQQGFLNTQATVEWAKANFGGKRLTSLVVGGSSAGSLGAQIWSRRLLQDFDYDSAAVIADSYIGVAPPGLQGQRFLDLGMCDTHLLSPVSQGACEAGTLDLQSLFEGTMRDFPEVAFANIDSKIDSVQIAFYELGCITLLDRVDMTMTPSEFYREAAAVYRRYNVQPNWVSYMVNSQAHMFLPEGRLYKTRPGSTVVKTSGLLGAGLSLAGVALAGQDTRLETWLKQLPVPRGGSVRSVCRGMASQPPQQSPLGAAFSGFVGAVAQEGADTTGLGRCDIGQADKIFERA